MSFAAMPINLKHTMISKSQHRRLMMCELMCGVELQKQKAEEWLLEAVGPSRNLGATR